jgi:hypothetical protein
VSCVLGSPGRSLGGCEGQEHATAVPLPQQVHDNYERTACNVRRVLGSERPQRGALGILKCRR